jgi:hypothetical protein
MQHCRTLLLRDVGSDSESGRASPHVLGPLLLGFCSYSLCNIVCGHSSMLHKMEQMRSGNHSLETSKLASHYVVVCDCSLESESAWIQESGVRVGRRKDSRLPTRTPGHPTDQGHPDTQQPTETPGHPTTDPDTRPGHPDSRPGNPRLRRVN